MRRTTWTATVLGLAATAGASAMLASSVRAADPQPPRVAVVDVQHVLERSPDWKRLKDEQMNDARALEELEAKQRERLQALAAQVETVPRAHPDRAAKEEQLARERTLAEFELKWKVARLERDRAEKLEQLYGQLNAIVRDVATAQGYSLVLLRRDERLNIERPQDFGRAIAARPVLFAADVLDLTPHVEARLQQGRPPTPPPAPPAMDR